MGGLNASGQLTALARTAETFYTGWFYLDTAPGSTNDVYSVITSALLEVVTIEMSSTQFIRIVGASNSSYTANAATVSGWNRVDVRVTSNGTSGVRLNGGTEVTCTAQNRTQDYWVNGNVKSNGTFTIYYDDNVIGTTVFPNGAGPYIRASVPTGAGTFGSGQWNSGTGTTYAEIDERPPDGGTTYIANANTPNNAKTDFSVTQISATGLVGNIRAVVISALFAEAAAGSSAVYVSIRANGTSGSDTTTVDLGGTAYAPIQKIELVSPDTGIAWTSTQYDTIQAVISKGSANDEVRCTQVVIHMVDDGVTAVPASLVLSAAAGVASVGTLTVSTSALLATGTVSGSAAPTLSVGSPTFLALSGAGGLSNATMGLTANALLSLGATGGTATAGATLISPVLLVLAADGLSSATGTVITLANMELSLSPTAGAATAVATLSTQGTLVLSPAPGVATASAVVMSQSFLQMGGAAGLSSAALGLRSPALLTLAASGLSSASALVQTEALLVLGSAAGLASASANVTSQVLLTLTAAGVASPALTVYSPVNLSLSAAGLSNATAVVISPALFTLLADGLSGATLAVKSPALLTLGTGGVALPTAELSSPAALVLSAAAGVAVVILNELSLGPSTRARIGAGHIPTVRISSGTMRPVIIQAGTARPARINGGY
jgi:hypothetical protein